MDKLTNDCFFLYSEPEVKPMKKRQSAPKSDIKPIPPPEKIEKVVKKLPLLKRKSKKQETDEIKITPVFKGLYEGFLMVYSKCILSILFIQDKRLCLICIVSFMPVSYSFLIRH